MDLLKYIPPIIISRLNLKIIKENFYFLIKIISVILRFGTHINFCFTIKLAIISVY